MVEIVGPLLSGSRSRGGERLESGKKITTKSRCPLTKERIKQLDEMGILSVTFIV